MKKNQDVFQYTYSSQEQEEIKIIRNKYVAPTEDKMAQLRRLDATVTKKANMLSILAGTIGTLILGAGMSLIMTDIANGLNVSVALIWGIGIVLGIVGMVFVACAYPIHNFVIKKEREKIAPEIIRLTDELLK